jgi:hypothetical protein
LAFVFQLHKITLTWARVSIVTLLQNSKSESLGALAVPSQLFDVFIYGLKVRVVKSELRLPSQHDSFDAFIDLSVQIIDGS